MHAEKLKFCLQDEAFLEDVSMILTTGEVPNLFPADEKAEILERVQVTAREEGRDIGESSFSNLYRWGTGDVQLSRLV